MNQSHFFGFVKQAASYGVNPSQAEVIYKQAFGLEDVGNFIGDHKAELGGAAAGAGIGALVAGKGNRMAGALGGGAIGGAAGYGLHAMQQPQQATQGQPSNISAPTNFQAIEDAQRSDMEDSQPPVINATPYARQDYTVGPESGPFYSGQIQGLQDQLAKGQSGMTSPEQLRDIITHTREGSLRNADVLGQQYIEPSLYQKYVNATRGVDNYVGEMGRIPTNLSQSSDALGSAAYNAPGAIGNVAEDICNDMYTTTSAAAKAGLGGVGGWLANKGQALQRAAQ